MKVPDWFGPGLGGAALGAVAALIIGFNWGGWTTMSSAARMVSEQSSVAVVSALVPFCVAKAQGDADPAKMVKFKGETSSYSRSDIVRSAGWATMPGMAAPDYALAEACATRMQTASAN
jgi:hypothetical protein